MKKIYYPILIMIAGFMIISCQNNSGKEVHEDDNQISVNVGTNAETTDTPVIVEASGSPAIAEFYEQAGTGGDPIQFLLYVNPGIGDDPATAIVNCDGIESEISSPTTGIWINNHCFITVQQNRVIIVLPDGSRMYADTGTLFQVNLSNEINEIILAKGEVYNRVSPQSTNEKYIITAGDMSIEAVGTEFGVSLKDELINVVVIDGTVYTHRCLLWKDHTCMKWTQVSSEMVSGNGYSGSIGNDKWTNIMLGDPVNGITSSSLEMPLSNTEAANGVWWFGGTTHQEVLDDSMFIMESLMIGELMKQDISYYWYNQKVDQVNTGTAYCTAYPESCPAAEIFITATPPVEPAKPSMSGGGPSGKFPEFDRSSCFTRDGHLWCYPVAGSVDVSMSGEWDLTAICAQYPGEIFCSW